MNALFTYVKKFDSNLHHRRSIRLKGYDYTQAGGYFVTICTHRHESILGKVVDGKMQLSPYGQIAFDFWPEIPAHFPNVEVAPFVIMPNHVHVIIMIHESRRGAVAAPLGGETPPVQDMEDGQAMRGETLPARDMGEGRVKGGETPPRYGLGQIVAYYKYQTTQRINALRGSPGVPFWQRNYYEHIIRNEVEWQKIWDYIQINPLRWEEDQLHPTAALNRFNR